MNLLDVFGKCNGINRLTYEDFRALGWSYNDYFVYMSFCDEIRAAAMMSEYVKKLDGITIKNHQKCMESLVVMRVQALFDWLKQFNNDNMPKPYGAYRWMITCIRYSMRDYYLHKEDSHEPNPGLLYRASYDFTVCVESYVSHILKNESLIDISPLFEKRIEEMDVNELNKKIDSLEFEISTIRDPDFPENPDNYVALMRWAKEQTRYEELDVLEDELDDCREQLERISVRIPDFDSAANILYVYRFGNIICKKEKHDLVDVNCVIKSAGKEIVLNAQYCRNCNKFIISEKSYLDYVEEYRLIPIKFQYVEENGSFPKMLYKTERGEYSPLSLAGYNVREKGGLTETERHNLLTSLIDNGAMAKNEIIRYLELFIKTNGAKFNMFRAVDKWQTDVEFVRRYNMENQDDYHIDRIERY